MTSKKLFNAKNLLGIFLATAIIAASIYISKSAIDFSKFAAFGYLGVFLASLIGSAVLFFPIPHLVTVFAGGVLFNPIGIAIAGGAGGAIGELVGYFVGYSGKGFVEQHKWYPKINNLFCKYGWIVIFVLALIPNLLFDLAGIIAGITRYNIAKYFIATLAGKVLRSLIIAYLGNHFGTM